MTAMAEGVLGDAESCCAVVAIIQAGLGWCYTVHPPQHLLSCETATLQPAAPSTKQTPGWGFRVSFGSARRLADSLNSATRELPQFDF